MKKDNNDLPNCSINPDTNNRKKYQKAKEKDGKLKLPINTDKLKLKE